MAPGLGTVKAGIRSHRILEQVFQSWWVGQINIRDTFLLRDLGFFFRKIFVAGRGDRTHKPAVGRRPTL